MTEVPKEQDYDYIQLTFQHISGPFYLLYNNVTYSISGNHTLTVSELLTSIHIIGFFTTESLNFQVDYFGVKVETPVSPEEPETSELNMTILAIIFLISITVFFCVVILLWKQCCSEDNKVSFKHDEITVSRDKFVGS